MAGFEAMGSGDLRLIGASGVNQHQAVNSRRMLERGERGDVATHRIADPVSLGDAQPIQSRAQRVGKEFDAVGDAGALFGASEARQIDRNRAVAGGEIVEVLLPILFVTAESVNEEYGGAFSLVDYAQLDSVDIELLFHDRYFAHR